MLALATETPPAGAVREPGRPSVFDLPQIQAKYLLLQSQIAALVRQGHYAEAEKRCQAAIQLLPNDPASHYNLACVQARQGRPEAALESLRKALALGFRDRSHMEQDEDLAGLRDRPEFKRLLEGIAAGSEPKPAWTQTIRPAEIQEGVAMVSEQNTFWDPRLGIFRSVFRFAEKPPAEPVVKGFDMAGKLVRFWYEEGTGAGNHGDLYDNHDSGHSNMDYSAFPHLARIEFADQAKSRGLHHGAQLRFLYNAPTVGNSSTAIVGGPVWRSQARHALTSPRGPLVLFLQYASNHLYVYPEHRDCDPGHNGADGKGYGDLLPANTPYMIISQGSSGSDRPFVHAVALTLAAFRPEVKRELARTGTLMAAVQMIFRSSNRMVRAPEDYLTGKAHPTAFDSRQLDLVRMVKMAQQITPDLLPPVVQIKVVDEEQPLRGVDFFDPVRDERLFDTPCAIARVVRSTRYLRRMVVSAEASRDLCGKPLTYHWAVLRGDAERIRINKLDASGSVVELLVPYHPRRPVQPDSELESNRVDIGAFVSNEMYYSAPAFICLFYLDNEKRVYDEKQRIRLVDYADPVVSKNYVDPALSLAKDWRDEYHYDQAGRLIGWTRIRQGAKERFTADGAVVTKTDEQDRPIEARKVRYVLKPRPGQLPALQEEQTDQVVRYQYSSKEDRIGRPVPDGAGSPPAKKP